MKHETIENMRVIYRQQWLDHLFINKVVYWHSLLLQKLFTQYSLTRERKSISKNKNGIEKRPRLKMGLKRTQSENTFGNLTHDNGIGLVNFSQDLKCQPH